MQWVRARVFDPHSTEEPRPLSSLTIFGPQAQSNNIQFLRKRNVLSVLHYQWKNSAIVCSGSAYMEVLRRGARSSMPTSVNVIGKQLGKQEKKRKSPAGQPTPRKMQKGPAASSTESE